MPFVQHKGDALRELEVGQLTLFGLAGIVVTGMRDVHVVGVELGSGS